MTNKKYTTEEKLEVIVKEMETMQGEIEARDNPENQIMKELKKMNSSMIELLKVTKQMNNETNIRIDNLANFFR